MVTCRRAGTAAAFAGDQCDHRRRRLDRRSAGRADHRQRVRRPSPHPPHGATNSVYITFHSCIQALGPRTQSHLPATLTRPSFASGPFSDNTRRDNNSHYQANSRSRDYARRTLEMDAGRGSRLMTSDWSFPRLNLPSTVPTKEGRWIKWSVVVLGILSIVH